jgi:hypothetical protein
LQDLVLDLGETGQGDRGSSGVGKGEGDDGDGDSDDDDSDDGVHDNNDASNNGDDVVGHSGGLREERSM